MRLDRGWTLTSTAPGVPPAADAVWRAAIVPGTVAQVVPGGELGDLDALDWWYRCSFAGAPGGRLRFEGLATLAEVWLNGELLFASRGMFTPRCCEVVLRDVNELVLCFRSLGVELAKKRPRPRWKTALVDAQNLRWIRTTLLGRISGWTPRIPPIGPWRAIVLETVTVDRLEVDGSTLRFSARVPPSVAAATLRVGEHAASLARDGARFSGELTVPDAPRWWPHTHGDPALLPCTLVLDSGVEIDCGRVGFRTVAFEDGRLAVNGRPIFCRGACWTVVDARSLDGAPDQLRQTLLRARAAGVNMLRVGGTMTYGSDAFYRTCDELGILVWQDFMFANLDYPFGDAAFAAEVEAEVVAQLDRLRRHPCVAVYCGGSEIEQQAAMLGLPPSEWSSPFFAETLPALCAARHPGVPYFPSTPTGGALPFHTSVGITHYYGVGAYRRPLSDARRARVRFTPECLGFSNVPDEVDHPPHHPAWKAGVPRDAGAGWDFEDVRDHYLGALFGVDPVALRSVDPERYFALSRAVTGEVMLRVFAEWRRPGSGCGGGLVWFLKDLVPGAGWGILDSANRPKSVWWYLRRAWARRAVLLTDEGLDGLDLHVLNETAEPLDGTVELELLGRRRVGFACAPVRIDPFGARTLCGDALLGAFSDLAHAYRFGPPAHDVVIARLLVGDAVIHEDVFFPGGHALPTRDAATLGARAEGGAVVLESSAFLQTVAISSPGYEPEDNYFHLSPGRPRTLRFTPLEGAKALKAHVGALNMEGFVTVRG